jgi:tetratricopeptide (TPR) repeat protein
MNAAPAQLHEAVRLMRGGEWAAALRHVDAALLSRPAEPRYLICRAQCLMALRRKSDALSAAEAAEQHASADAVVRDAAATLYTHANDHARALQSYDAALAWDPNNAQYYYNRASVRRFVGDLEGAEQDYDRAIALRPSDYEAYKHRSDLRTQTTQRNHVAQLRALLALPAGAESTAVTPIAGPPVAAPSSLDWRGEVLAILRHARGCGASAAAAHALRFGDRPCHRAVDHRCLSERTAGADVADRGGACRPRGAPQRGGAHIRAGAATQRHDLGGAHFEQPF